MARQRASRSQTAQTVATQASESQVSVQQEMFRSLLKTPHRQADETIALHATQYARDPNFYGHMAVHAVMKGGCVTRDINEVFIAQLFASEFPSLREAAFVMLQYLPPYEVLRVARFVTGYKETRTIRSCDPAIPTQFGTTVTPLGSPRKITLSKPLKARLVKQGKITRQTNEITTQRVVISHPGFGKRTVHGQLKRAISAYLRTREHPLRRDMLESGLLRARETFRALYAKSHTLPGGSDDSWINQYLFHGKSETGTRLHALRELTASSDPTVQAEIILKNRIPYPIAISAIKNITPSVVVALIDAMTPQELMSNIKNLARRGATEDPKVKELIAAKLQKAKGAKGARIDAMKGAFAAEQVKEIDADLAEILTEVTDAQIKQHGTIRGRVALLIDKSASMSPAIALAKELGAVLAQGCQHLMVYTFDFIPTAITIQGDATTRSAWEKALEMVRANGGTEPNQVIRKMIADGVEVDHILLLTDEGENKRGSFAKELEKYQERFGFVPHIAILRLGREGGYPFGACDYIESSCRAAGYDVDMLRCEAVDKVSIPNVMQLLSRKTAFDLIQEILALPLPTKTDWKKNSEQSLSKLEKQASKVKAKA